MSEEKSFLVISAMGSDRAGIVDEFSRFVFERGCNIEDSRMALLGAEFAFIALLSGGKEEIRRVQEEMPGFAQQCGLIISGKLTTKTPPPARPELIPYRLTGTGMDHPGVVHRFSRLLHERGINIVSMETHSYHAPITGTPLFHFEALIEVPVGLTVAALRQELNSAAEEENMDVELTPAVP